MGIEADCALQNIAHWEGWEYDLTLVYRTEAKLEEIINDIYREMTFHADTRYCFIEADMSALDGSDRRW